MHGTEVQWYLKKVSESIRECNTIFFSSELYLRNVYLFSDIPYTVSFALVTHYIEEVKSYYARAGQRIPGYVSSNGNCHYKT